MEEQKNNRNRNTYLVLIAAGVFLLLEKSIGFTAVVALFLMFVGFQQIRSSGEKKGYILFGIGAILLVGSHFAFVVALVLISLGFFYLKSRSVHGEEPGYVRQKLIESLKYDKEPWVVRQLSAWNVIGEIKMDFSLGIFEQEETVLILQGVVGDIDIILPEDLGVSVQGSLTLGQMDIGKDKEAGVMNKIYWQSPNYASSGNRVKLIISYLVGDIDIKVI
jgi:lia operon protein LiaF